MRWKPRLESFLPGRLYTDARAVTQDVTEMPEVAEFAGHLQETILRDLPTIALLYSQNPIATVAWYTASTYVLDRINAEFWFE